MDNTLTAQTPDCFAARRAGHRPALRWPFPSTRAGIIILERPTGNGAKFLALVAAGILPAVEPARPARRKKTAPFSAAHRVVHKSAEVPGFFPAAGCRLLRQARGPPLRGSVKLRRPYDARILRCARGFATCCGHRPARRLPSDLLEDGSLHLGHRQ
jgi:hypothetical protein